MITCDSYLPDEDDQGDDNFDRNKLHDTCLAQNNEFTSSHSVRNPIGTDAAVERTELLDFFFAL